MTMQHAQQIFRCRVSVLSVVNRLLIGSMYPANHSKDQSRKGVFCGIRGWSLSIFSFAWSVRVYSSLMKFLDGTTDDTAGTDRRGVVLLHLQSVLSVLSVVNRVLIGSMYPANHSKDPFQNGSSAASVGGLSRFSA